ncbi:MAG: hypothetical protein HKP41_22965 [Desulfobacterales bacterium]|nr:hypothetical protein [Deltaproteobacteria bacterium]NNK97227.1 hypothetical protein [Desulfobacterales bacterium]
MRPYTFVLALCFLAATALLEKAQAGEIIDRIKATNELLDIGISPVDFLFAICSETI